MAKMNEQELIAITDAEIQQSNGGNMGSALAESRRKAEQYYLGRATGDLAPSEIEGRSNFVDTTIRNQIEWMMPTLMKTFCSGDNVVEFSASKEGEDEKASIATDYLNYIFFKQNEGYKVLQTAIRDALLHKAGIIKVWWDDKEIQTKESYKALSDLDLAQLMDDKEIEPIDQEAYIDEDDFEERTKALEQLNGQLQQALQAAQMGDQAAIQGVQELSAQIEQINATPPKMLYDVSFKRTKKGGKVCVECVPPDEFLISRKSKSISDGFMKGHKVLRSISDLKAAGYKNVDNIQSDESSYQTDRVERDSFNDDLSFHTEDSLDPSMRMVWLTELYMQVDYDGDGIAEWRKIVRAGNQVLENEECDGAPFAALIPIYFPHRFYGLSIADLGFEPQRLQTQLVRLQIDNAMLQANGRNFAVEGQVNLDDLMMSRPGGVVRMKAPGMAGRLDQGQGNSAETMQLLEWAQDFTENATGYTRRSQGTGPTGLQQQTATGMNIITNRDDLRMDLVARNFAEGGISDLFKLMMKLVCQYQEKAEMIAVTGKFVQADPREWKNQFSLNVNVGLGTNNKEQQANHLMGLLNIQKEGLDIGITDPEKLYNAAKLYAEALGQKSGDKFFINPKDAPPAPPQPSEIEVKTQLEKAKFEGSMQLDMQKHQLQLQLEDRKLALQAQTRAQELEMESQKQAMLAQLDMEERQHKAELDAQLQVQQIEFDRWKAELDYRKAIEVAQINANSKLQAAEMQSYNAQFNDTESSAP